MGVGVGVGGLGAWVIRVGTASGGPHEEARLRQAGATILFWIAEQRLRNFRAMALGFPGNGGLTVIPPKKPGSHPMALGKSRMRPRPSPG